jgi:CBS domain-containing protein
MHAKNIRFVVVVDDEGRLSALTGQKGLMEYVAEQFHREVVAHRIDVIQSRPFASVQPTLSISDAVRKLVREKIACLLIEMEERLIGVFSDRDVLDKVALEYDRVKDDPVSDVMNRKPRSANARRTAFPNPRRPSDAAGLRQTGPPGDARRRRREIFCRVPMNCATQSS